MCVAWFEVEGGETGTTGRRYELTELPAANAKAARVSQSWEESAYVVAFNSDGEAIGHRVYYSGVCDQQEGAGFPASPKQV